MNDKEKRKDNFIFFGRFVVSLLYVVCLSWELIYPLQQTFRVGERKDNRRERRENMDMESFISLLSVKSVPKLREGKEFSLRERFSFFVMSRDDEGISVVSLTSFSSSFLCDVVELMKKFCLCLSPTQNKGEWDERERRKINRNFLVRTMEERERRRCKWGRTLSTDVISLLWVLFFSSFSSLVSRGQKRELRYPTSIPDSRKWMVCKVEER